MQVNEALTILKIDSIDELTLDNLKSAYRKMMKKNHPDIGGSVELSKQINEANETLKNYIGQIDLIRMRYGSSKQQEPIYIADLLDYINIYNGIGLEFRHNGSATTIDKTNIYKHRVILSILLKVGVDGVYKETTELILHNDSDVYSITYKILINDLSQVSRVHIELYGIHKEFDIKGMATLVNFDLDYNVRVSIRIERQLVEDDK